MLLHATFFLHFFFNHYSYTTAIPIVQTSKFQQFLMFRLDLAHIYSYQYMYFLLQNGYVFFLFLLIYLFFYTQQTYLYIT